MFQPRIFKTILICVLPGLISGCMEACDKKYTLTGRVTTSMGNPRPGLDVIFTRGQHKIQGQTNANGEYAFVSTTKGDFTGFEIGFEANGIEVGKSAPLTAAEVSSGDCGDHPAILRNVTID